MKFPVKIEWSEEDQVFLAWVDIDEIAGLIAHGYTRWEALDELESLVQEYLISAQMMGWPIPESLK